MATDTTATGIHTINGFLRRHSTAILATGLVVAAAGWALGPVLAGAVLFTAGAPLLVLGLALKVRLHPALALLLAIAVAAYLGWELYSHLD